MKASPSQVSKSLEVPNILFDFGLKYEVKGLFCLVQSMKSESAVYANSDDRRELEDGNNSGTYTVVEKVRPRLKKPPMYRVVLINDDFTPMEFVVEVLEMFFGMHRERATRVMLKVHTEGKAVCGIYTRDIAETKAGQVNQYARECEHPLLCEVELSEGDDERN